MCYLSNHFLIKYTFQEALLNYRMGPAQKTLFYRLHLRACTLNNQVSLKIIVCKRLTIRSAGAHSTDRLYWFCSTCLFDFTFNLVCIFNL